ncbi:DUF423 domain-containing protein [Hyphomonas sp. WL0036]|uniref:DUF423 domain-containing protein n=1 Tax=Hyphomonas sediminis TaxID=2866160 RepID=UPI001C7F3E14|nr:DUF423 domain-containing protein [Hyphomonas sediminis]MBY9066640.1 DUF423 domain-containing protein [Hyphomonas sediminis]
MNRLVTAAALIGFLSVALGAFGAHALDGRLTDEGLEWWHTATLYGLTHAGVALAAGLATRGGKLVIGGWLIVVGAVIFAATLYAMALGAPRWLGAVTPLGGISMLSGWIFIGLSGLSRPLPTQDAAS